MGHNLDFEKQAPEEVRARNLKLLAAYNSMLVTIDRIQGLLEDDFLRTRIESDMKSKPDIQSTILQVTTPWCLISLGCDTMGRYSIVYSIDYRIQEMIGAEMASGIIRRIYEYTPGEMEPFVQIGSLYQDCVEVFTQLMEEQKTERVHKVIVKDKVS